MYLKGRSARNNHKTTSSRTLCEEKLSCRSEKVDAIYFCHNCNSKQCKDCDKELHQYSRRHAHYRTEIPAPDKEKLCQSTNCYDLNYATVTCKDCSLNFCSQCFANIHAQSKKRFHKKVRYTFKEKVSPETEVLNDQPGVDTNSSGGEFDSLKTDPDSETSSLAFLSIEDHFSDIDNMPKSSRKKSDHTDSKESCDAGQHSNSDIDSIFNSEDFYGPSESIQIEHSVSVTNDSVHRKVKSFLLIDQKENIQVEDEEEFLQTLKLGIDCPVKVVSIFGNTGDGKSHTLNHTFFRGQEVFKTSSEQLSCTAGIWAAHDPERKILVLDTEGLLGVCNNQNQRTRLLLKVLAVSDVVIYRTKADRLTNDMFGFLADASKSYCKHFKQELESASSRFKLEIPITRLGPSVIIFHETLHTDCLPKDSSCQILRARFQELRLSLDAFSCLSYVGTRTRPGRSTDFSTLLQTVKRRLDDTSVRSPRSAKVVFKSLEVLNNKFNGDIENPSLCTFPDQYFTCPEKCLSCSNRCELTMNHTNMEHSNKNGCRYQHQFDNKIFICKKCHSAGRNNIVVPKTSAANDSSWFGLAKYAWSGYVLECPACGVIYRSREYWYGNLDPEQQIVRTEIRHVWSGGNTVLQGTHNAGRRLLDTLNYAKNTVTSMSAGPSKTISNWITDQIAPPYWRPNSEIKECRNCHIGLVEQQIHHCRACGEGFCDDCSTERKPVPERGWGFDLVRVCDECYHQPKEVDSCDHTQLRARRVGEAVGSTFEYIASVAEYPLERLRDSARPAYWKPDVEIKKCHVCAVDFGPKLSLHHCRKCGEGICDDCSRAEREVPSRGWDYPVRVCDKCNKLRDPL